MDLFQDKWRGKPRVWFLPLGLFAVIWMLAAYGLATCLLLLLLGIFVVSLLKRTARRDIWNWASIILGVYQPCPPPCYHAVRLVGIGATAVVRLGKRTIHPDPECGSKNCFPVKPATMLDSVCNPVDQDWHLPQQTAEIVIKDIGLRFVAGLEGREDDLTIDSQEWVRLKENTSPVMKLKHRNVLIHYQAQLLPQKQDVRRCLLFVESCHGDLLYHLKAQLDAVGRIPLSNYGLQILSGMDYVHEAGIAHKDIKAANILVKYQNGYPVLKIGDFGEMSVILANMTLPNTCSKWVGTISHMSPEMLEKQAIDAKLQVGRLTDIYSLGCVFLELVATEGDVTDKKTHVPRFYKSSKDGVVTYLDWSNLSTFNSVTTAWLGTVAKPNYAYALRSFLTEDEGRVEVTHSPRLSVVRDKNRFYHAVRHSQSSQDGVLRWMENSGYENGWPEYESVIRHCLLPLLQMAPGHVHDYALSFQDGPRNYLRPVARHLLDNPVFKVGSA